MRLESVRYSEFDGTPQEWRLEGLRLGPRNLIVGKNASGKTRVLNVVNGISGHLAGLRPPAHSGSYDVTFADGDNRLRYELICDREEVVKERFTVDNRRLLDRGKDGRGTIWAEQIDRGKEIPFQIPLSTLAAVAKQDAIQHPFLEPLHAWASSVRLFPFGSSLGKDHVAVLVEKGGVAIDERNTDFVVGLYRKAEKEFKDEFKGAVISDMQALQYGLQEIGVCQPISVRLPGLPGEPVGLYVRENALPGIIDQFGMSQGMFRALSVLVQVNYSRMTHNATCILIDDIGEGLDFERSWRLIKLLREKASESNIQLILSTNDRFVMNHVPLEEWSVLQRTGGLVRVRNYENSRDVFEEFKFTGLSNFSFLEMDFISGSQSEEASAL
jgi:energy-coupling factor transporter ATP-binding protein EcfA2